MSESINIILQKDRRLALALVGAVMLFAAALFVNVPSALAADGDLTAASETVLDSNLNGKLNRITFTVVNAAVETWQVNGSPQNAALTVLDTDNSAITVSAISLTTAANANPVGFQVDLDETDVDLLVATAAGDLDLVYVQAGGGSGCTNCLKDTSQELTAVADESQTVTDGAKPVIKSFTYQDADADGKIDQLLITFSETMDISSTLVADDLSFTNVGDFTGAAIGAAGADIITADGGTTATLVLGTEATAVDTNEGSGNIAIQVDSPSGFSLQDDAAPDNVNLATGAQSQATFIDGAAPVIISGVYADTAAVDGEVDRVVYTTSADVGITCAGYDDNDVAVVEAGTVVLSTAGVDTCASNGTSTVTITLGTVGAANTTGGAVNPTVTFTSGADDIQDGAGNDVPTSTALALTDGAQPIIVSATLTTSGAAGAAYNRATLVYSETMTVTGGNGASTSARGDMTAAGVITGFGSFSTVGDVTIATTKNTIAGSGSATITIDMAAQSGGVLAGGTTRPAGNFTPEASAQLLDAVLLQAQTTLVASTSGTAWDLTKPTINLLTVHDAANNNGRIDRAQFTFSENVRDSSFTNGSGSLRDSVPNTQLGSFSTDVGADVDVDDDRLRFDGAADATLIVDTAGETTDFLYSAAGNLITDFAGNLLNTATDGTVVDDDVTQTDAADPIVLSVTLSDAGTKNQIAIVYSEAMTLTGGNGNSTATIGAYTAAGTLAGFGGFATANTAAMVGADDNALTGTGTATITITMANGAAPAYYVTTSTTAPSGAFTPVAIANLVDAGTNQVNILAAAPTSSGSWDLTKPTITSVTIQDSLGANGRVDRATLVLSEEMLDANITPGNGTIGGVAVALNTGATANDATMIFEVTTDTAAVDTSAEGSDLLYSGATTPITDDHGNFVDTITDGSIVDGDITQTDTAQPIVTLAAFSNTGTRNRLSLTYSEAITIGSGNGASSTARGDMTTQGTITGFGSLSTVGNATVPTTLNTIGGSTTSTITIDFADQAAAYFNSTSTTQPSGNFAPSASSNVIDGANNQVNSGQAVVPASGGTSWDLTKPTITTSTVADASGNNGRIDRATIVFSKSMRDASFTTASGTIAGQAGAFTTGVADDATQRFDVTSDASIAQDTSAEASDFLYSTGGNLLTDLAGNLLDVTGTDGLIADGDVTQTDGASPILISITKGTSSGLNRLTLVYSEAVTYSTGNGASSATCAAVTTAGTIVNVGTFATAGDTAANAATANTVAGSGTATVTIDLAAQATGNLVTTSTTEPSGVFTPIANACAVDAATNQVNVANTPTTLGSGWDLTKPTIAIAVSDADADGEIETATLTFSESIRDNSITAADASLGAGGTAPAFATGTANDATTVFSRSDDNTANTTGLGAHTDFVYSAVTTSIRDVAGNLVESGVTDGDIASGDVTETDSARPIIVSATLTTSGAAGAAYNRATLVYSEIVNVTGGNGASTSARGDMTTAGTVTGFGSFSTVGDVTIATLKNTIAGSGSATITIDMAAQSGGSLAGGTTRPAGNFTPTASAQLLDAALNQAQTTLVASTSGTAWDLTKPTLSSIAVSDSANDDGEIDRATFTFSENVRDSSFTNADATLGSGGTTTGTFDAGIPDDMTMIFNRTVDDNGVNTAASAGNFVYSGATTSLTDFAGNLLDTATDGQIATGDATELDSASPILVSITKGTSSGLNRLTLVYSEVVTYSTGNGASSATCAAVTTAGTIVNVGTFATVGNTATNAATANTVAGSGTATVTIDLAAQATGNLVTASTTEPSGVFTPIAHACVVDAAATPNQVNVANTPATLGSGWDLTKPDVTITVSDADNDGEIETATLVFSESVRDNSITNANATLGAAGTPGGTFATGTANDATTVFSRTDDNTANTTGLGTHTDFVYSGATTLIRDTAGNLYDGTADGAIASTDEIEVDGASPIVVSRTTGDADSDGKIDQVVIVYSEDLNGATVTDAGDYTVTGYTINSSSETAAGTVTVVLAELTSYDTGAVPSTTSGASISDTAGIAAILSTAAATDGAGPILVSASPTAGGVLIPATANFTMTFSEAMEAFTDTAGSTSSIAPSTGTINLTTSSTIITADPQGSSFSPGLTITITLYGTADALEDANGVDFNEAGIVLGTDAGENATFQFTTQNPSSGGGGGGGGGGASTVSVTADAVTVTSPNGGEVLTGGAQHDITWTSTGNVNNVNLYYSVDGGSVFGLIAAGTANDGSYTWTVPNTATGQALVKAVGRDSGGATLATDQSNAAFAIGISSALPVVEAPTGSTQVGVPTGSMSRADAEAALPATINVDYLVRVADDGDPTTDFDTTVYYVGLDAKRHPFVNSQIYFTWYENFDSVRTIDGAVLTAIPLGVPVLVRPGTMMVKIQSDPRTFAVEPGDYTIRWVPTEEVAVALYGSAWNKRILDIEPTYWSRFTMGSDLTADLHPAGSVLKDAAGAKFYFDGVNKRAFASGEAFSANMFQEKYVIVNPSSTGWMSAVAGAAITGFEDSLFSLQR